MNYIYIYYSRIQHINGWNIKLQENQLRKQSKIRKQLFLFFAEYNIIIFSGICFKVFLDGPKNSNNIPFCIAQIKIFWLSDVVSVLSVSSANIQHLKRIFGILKEVINSLSSKVPKEKSLDQIGKSWLKQIIIKFIVKGYLKTITFKFSFSKCFFTILTLMHKIFLGSHNIKRNIKLIEIQNFFKNRCLHHFKNQVVVICIADLKCQYQRRLCAECQDEHGGDSKYLVSIKKFKEMVLKKFQESWLGLDQTSVLTKLRMAFKSLLSQMEIILKKISQDLSKSIKTIFDWIEQENKSYVNLINENKNLAESSYTDLEKMVSIIQGSKLKDWNDEMKSYLMELDITKNQLELETITFRQNLEKEMEKILYEGEEYQKKEDLYEILTSIQDIDETILKVIIEMARQEKTSNILRFISKPWNFKLYQLFVNQQQAIRIVKQKIMKITNVLRNLQEHSYSKDDYSIETYENQRSNIIKKIAGNKKIQFLVYLTSIDDQFIQCGSNGLNLLVKMKVDLSYQSFENIRIKNASLIGGNFFRCNFSQSEFENVDVREVNLNGALLFNCKWKNIKIHELNKLDGRTPEDQSVCFSSDGTIQSDNDDKSIILGGGQANIIKSRIR